MQTGPLYGPTVYLDHIPVETVTSVTVYGPAVGSTGTVLVEDETYALLGPESGVLSLAGAGYGGAVPWPNRVEVLYKLVENVPVPADVSYACALTVASWFAAELPAGSLSGAGGAFAAAASGLKRYSVGQELTVEFAERSSEAEATGGPGAPIPPGALALLLAYGYPTAGRPVFA